MLIAGTILVMLATAYAQYRNGLFSSFAMLFMVIVSGVVAFNFFEPIADAMESSFQQNSLAGCEDFLAIIIVFSATLFALRFATNYLAPEMLEAHGTVQFYGAAAVGLVTGYFVAGFFICAMETLPLDERFLDFEPRGEKTIRNLFPPDRVWIAVLRQAGSVPLSSREDPAAEAPEDRYVTFDRYATFELRYLRYRRTTESRLPMKYQGEFDVDLGKKPR